MVHRILIAFATAVALLGGLAYAQADVVIIVNKSTQRLSVAVNGTPRYEWPVSTARMGYNTPNGTYRPERLARQWFSRKYDWSPMPHSIFFNGGYAIHGSYEIRRLGTPASHGCIRLHPNNAATLYSLVEQNRNSTRIVVTGDRPSHLMVTRERHPRSYADDDYRPPRSVYGRPHRAPRYVEDEDIPPRALRKKHPPRYVEEDDIPTSSLRGSRVRYRRGSFEDIFN